MQAKKGMLSSDDFGTRVSFPLCDWNIVHVPRRPACFLVVLPKKISSSLSAAFTALCPVRSSLLCQVRQNCSGLEYNVLRFYRRVSSQQKESGKLIYYFNFVAVVYTLSAVDVNCRKLYFFIGKGESWPTLIIKLVK